MSEVTQDRMDWWREARFGMFIHWGLYAIPAGEWKGERIPGIGEWIMRRAEIPIEDYERLAEQFNPVKFDAEEWVSVAKAAGMKYLVITSKHHDGFALFKSSHPYNIVDATPYKRDPMTELAEACRKAGIRLCFYYSQAQDWHAPGGAGHWELMKQYPDRQSGVTPEEFAAYLDEKVEPQLREILTQYGPIGLIWFDTPQRITREQSTMLRDLVHELQPDCLVSGRVGHDVGDYGSLGDNQHPVGAVAGDWETPCTLNDTWGFKHYDHNWKSVDYLVKLLVNCASKGVNYLLNVGPTAEGVIPAPSVDSLQAVGDWMKVNGEAIYGTAASPFAYDFDWGRITCKQGRLYLHFMEWPGESFSLLGIRNRVTGARLLADGRELVGVEQRHDADTDEHLIELTLPADAPDAIVSVVALDIDGAPDVDIAPLQQLDGAVTLPAHMAERAGDISIDRNGAVAGWTASEPRLEWTCKIRQPGTFRVLVQTCMDRHNEQRFGTHGVTVQAGSDTVSGQAGRKDMIMDEQVNRWHIAESDIGTVTIAGSGPVTVSLKADAIAPAPAGLTAAGVKLVKV